MKTTRDSAAAREHERRARELRARDWQLWSLGLLIMAVLMSGVLCLVFPNVHTTFQVESRYLPHLSLGLIGLVLLFNFYLIEQRHLLDASRSQLIREQALEEDRVRFAPLDALTQVFRRAYFPEILDREVTRANRSANSLTFMMVRHGAVETLTKRYGKIATELLIADIAMGLRQNFRGADSIIRFSDCEFLVLLPNTTEHQSHAARERLERFVDRWNLESTSPCEMSLKVSAVEYRFGKDPTKLIDSLAATSLTPEDEIQPMLSHF